MHFITHRERVKAFLASGVPNFISQNTVLQSTFLCEEGRAYCRLLILLEFVLDLKDDSIETLQSSPLSCWTHESKDHRRFTNGSLSYKSNPSVLLS